MNTVSKNFIGLLAFLFLVGCATSPTLSELDSFNGKTVGEFLDHYSLKYSDGIIGVEPPAKLYRLTYRNAAEFGQAAIVLYLNNEKLPVSANYKWDEDAVRALRIRRIEIGIAPPSYP